MGQPVKLIKGNIVELNSLVKKSDKSNSSLSLILLLKTLKQLLDISLTLKILDEKETTSS